MSLARARRAPHSAELPASGSDPRIWMAALVTVTLWASAFIAIRGAAPYFDPGSMALLRMAVGSIVLGLIVAWRGVVWPPRRVWPLVIGWGIAWFCFYNLALNTAEKVMDAGTAAMIVNLAPLIVVLIAGLLLSEGFPRALIVGAPVSFAGVALIGVESWTGAFLPELRSAPVGATLSVVYMGIFPTAIAFTTWAFVLRRLSAGRTSATTYVVPAMTLVLSWAVRGEAPTPITLLGGALCLAGVFIAQARRRRTAPPSVGGPANGR